MGTEARGWRTVATVLGVVGILPLAACTADGQGDGENGDSGPATSMLLTADSGSPEYDRNFNPFSPGSRTTTTIIYEPLYVVNIMNGDETPFLASSKEQSDPSTVSFTIRDDVSWSDGEQFTPDDVLFTFELLREHPALDTDGVWTLIDTIEIDGQEVVFRLKEASVPAAAIIQQTVIVPEHLWADIDDPTTYTNEDPVGTGPYVLGEFFPNEYTLERNEAYWQAENVVADELILPASRTALDLVNEEYDWAYAPMADVEETWVAAGDHNSYWFPPGGTIALVPNHEVEPFNDTNFRLGLSYALDRDRIAEVAGEGNMNPAGMSGLLLPNHEEWLNPDLTDRGEIAQDADTALEYFEASGYTMSGDRLVDENGEQLSITLTTPNGWNDWLRGATEAQRQLSAIGIDVTLNQPQPAAYQQEFQNGNFELAMGSFGDTGSLYQDFNNLLNSEFSQPVGTSTLANFQRYSNPETDALLNEFRITLDENRQLEIAHELQRVVYDQAPVVSLFYGGLWGLFSEQNYTGWPSADNPYASPVPHDSNALLILTNLELAN